MGGEQALPRAQDRLVAVRGEGSGRDPRPARVQGQEGQVQLIRGRRRGGHSVAGQPNCQLYDECPMYYILDAMQFSPYVSNIHCIHYIHVISLLKVANKKFEKITAEVESLKAVLEMKTVEVRTLRNENVRLAEKVNESMN